MWMMRVGFRQVAAGLALGWCGLAHAAPPVADLGLLPGDGMIAPSVNSQQDAVVARGNDESLVVWSDMRSTSSGSQTNQGDGDVYGQRLDGAGQPVGPAFLIAGGMGLQDRPMVAWNGSNYLVVYRSQDPVGGFYETRVRWVRVSSAGQVLDAVPGVLPPTQFEPSTIGLNVGGVGGQWMIVRCVYHADGNGTYLAGQRVSGAGVLLDVTPRMLIDWVYGSTRVLAANGELLVAGPDWNTSTTIRARRINPDGTPAAAAFTAPSLDIATNGSEFYVSWISAFVNRVGSRMTATGTLLNPSGTLLFSDPAISFYSVSLAHDGTNWWFAWSAGSAVRTTRIGPDGAVLDPGGVPMPIEIGGTIDQAYGVTLTGRSGGGVLLTWHDLRPAMGYDANVFTIPVSPGNEPGPQVCVSSGSRNQRSAKIAPGPGGTMAVAFVSEGADGADRVLVHLLDAAGTPVSVEPVLVRSAGTIGQVGLAWNGAVFMVVWDEGPLGLTPTQVLSARLNPDGSLVEPEPQVVMTGFNPDVGALGDDFLVAAARYGATPQTLNLWGRRYDGATGGPLDGASVQLATGFVSGLSRVRSDGAGWLVASHSMWSALSSQGDALLVRVPASGPPGPANNPTPFSGGTGDLDVAFSGSKYLLVWRSNTLGSANNSIAGRIMNADGSLVPGWFTIAEAPGRQLRPTVTWDGATFLVAWDDQRNQQSFFDARTDVYMVRVSETGTVLDTPAFAGVDRPGIECSPAITSIGGVTFAATTRFVGDATFNSYRVGMSTIGAPACAPATVQTQPVDDVECGRGTAVFEIVPGGSLPRTLRWQAEHPAGSGSWVDLADGPDARFGVVKGAGGPLMSIGAFESGAATAYRCVVTNGCGEVTSEAATLTVCWSDFSCDGVVNSTDVSEFINAWFQDQVDGTLVTDWDSNGVVNSTDVSEFINGWFDGVVNGC